MWTHAVRTDDDNQTKRFFHHVLIGMHLCHPYNKDKLSFHVCSNQTTYHMQGSR
ncbi:hypothetical protein Scep_005572 [Stephania cephalantha]|uniref:Uncharacterized protein n=1 Tax=Stephania cephalantha TaxID=152367 RepID=A0AAP0KUI9_9MAGN